MKITILKFLLLFFVRSSRKHIVLIIFVFSVSHSHPHSDWKGSREIEFAYEKPYRMDFRCCCSLCLHQNFGEYRLCERRRHPYTEQTDETNK